MNDVNNKSLASLNDLLKKECDGKMSSQKKFLRKIFADECGTFSNEWKKFLDNKEDQEFKENDVELLLKAIDKKINTKEDNIITNKYYLAIGTLFTLGALAILVSSLAFNMIPLLIYACVILSVVISGIKKLSDDIAHDTNDTRHLQNIKKTLYNNATINDLRSCHNNYNIKK